MFDKNRIFIAAPFGVYLFLSNAIRIKGTYTLVNRPGRITQAIKTIRYTTDGIINQMGYRNPGISSAIFKNTRIYSIGVVESHEEWDLLLEVVPDYVSVELNLGCPNVKDLGIRNEQLQKYLTKFKNIVVKVPGKFDNAQKLIYDCYEQGVRIFDICNTIPTERGGLSGRKVQEVSLPLIQDVKSNLSDVYVIGSGGIYSEEDVKKYRDVGTDGYSLGTIFMACPWNIPIVMDAINESI